jgi:hypothetical protein
MPNYEWCKNAGSRQGLFSSLLARTLPWIKYNMYTVWRITNVLRSKGTDQRNCARPYLKHFEAPIFVYQIEESGTYKDLNADIIEQGIPRLTRQIIKNIKKFIWETN